MKVFQLITMLFLFFATTHATAQEDIYEEIAKKTCSCITQKDVSKMSEQELTMELGICMIGNLGEVEGASDLNLDFTNNQAMEKFGEQIGIKMVKYCPDVFMQIGMAGNFEVDDKQEQTEEIQSVTGTIQEIGGTDFNIITLKGDDGRTHKLLWIGYFEGSDQLLAMPKKGIGKKVTVNFFTRECFSPKIGEYYNCKEIILMEF